MILENRYILRDTMDEYRTKVMGYLNGAPRNDDIQSYKNVRTLNYSYVFLIATKEDKDKDNDNDNFQIIRKNYHIELLFLLILNATILIQAMKFYQKCQTRDSSQLTEDLDKVNGWLDELFEKTTSSEVLEYAADLGLSVVYPIDTETGDAATVVRA